MSGSPRVGWSPTTTAVVEHRRAVVGAQAALEESNCASRGCCVPRGPSRCWREERCSRVFVGFIGGEGGTLLNVAGIGSAQGWEAAATGFTEFEIKQRRDRGFGTVRCSLETWMGIFFFSFALRPEMIMGEKKTGRQPTPFECTSIFACGVRVASVGTQLI